MQIFGLMNLIIDRLGDSVKPYAEGLLRLLPSVWQDAEGQSLLRIQVTAATPAPLHPCGPFSLPLHLPAPWPLGCSSHKLIFVVNFSCSMQAWRCKQPVNIITEMRSSFIVLWYCLQQQRTSQSELLTANTYTPPSPCAHVIPCRQSFQQSTGDAVLQVLLVLQRLVNALGPDSPGCYNLLLPILQQCTAIDQV